MSHRSFHILVTITTLFIMSTFRSPLDLTVLVVFTLLLLKLFTHIDLKIYVPDVMYISGENDLRGSVSRNL